MTAIADRCCLYCGTRLDHASFRCRSCGEMSQPWASTPETTWWQRLREGVKKGQFRHIPVDHIVPNPFQPREDLDVGTPEFERLKQSVGSFGVIVPLLVRSHTRRIFQLVAGQRRLAAAREMGVKRVPAVVFDLSDRELQEIAYLENMHRRNLNALDDIRAFLRLAEKEPSTEWTDLAQRLGCDLRDVRARRRLLDLPVLLQEAVSRGFVDPAQAEALAEASARYTIESLVTLAVARGLPPHEIRALARPGENGGLPPGPVI